MGITINIRKRLHNKNDNDNNMDSDSDSDFESIKTKKPLPKIVSNNDSDDEYIKPIKTKKHKKTKKPLPKIVSDDSDSDFAFDLNYKPVKSVKPVKLTNQTEHVYEFTPKKSKPKGKDFIHNVLDISKENVGKLLKIRDNTIKKIETLCCLNSKDMLLSQYSKFGTIEASYYLITRKILKYECSECESGPVWHKRNIHLFLDHINNNNNDYKLNNLRFLCPNCNVQQNGQYAIDKSTNKSKKRSCSICRREFVTSKMNGNKCKECINVQMLNEIAAVDPGLKRYKKESGTENSFGINDILKPIGGMLYTDDIVNELTTIKYIDNEKKKAKIKSKSKHTTDDNENTEVKKAKNLNGIDLNKSLMIQLINKIKTKQIDTVMQLNNPKPIKDENDKHAFTFKS
jgi:Zn finger protein HypA/HybF involved in hydrogenase expression